MTQFQYKAINKQGVIVAGTIDAMDRGGAVAVLSDQGRFVTEMSEMALKAQSLRAGVDSVAMPSSSMSGGGRISGKDLVAITSQFCTALKAGLPLMKCLELLRDQQKKPGPHGVLDNLVQTVSAGQSLSDALAAHPKVFSPLYVSMIRVGETGGILEQTTQQLAGILKRDDKVRTSMKSALAYPTFVLCLGVISVAIIVTWILPNVMSNLDVDAAMLPWPTRVLMASSSMSKGLLTTMYGWIGLAFVGGGGFFGVASTGAGSAAAESFASWSFGLSTGSGTSVAATGRSGSASTAGSVGSGAAGSDTAPPEAAAPSAASSPS